MGSSKTTTSYPKQPSGKTKITALKVENGHRRQLWTKIATNDIILVGMLIGNM